MDWHLEAGQMGWQAELHRWLIIYTQVLGVTVIHGQTGNPRWEPTQAGEGVPPEYPEEVLSWALDMA